MAGKLKVDELGSDNGTLIINPSDRLDLSGSTGSLRLPNGTSAQETTATGHSGVRYNQSESKISVSTSDFWYQCDYELDTDDVTQAGLILNIDYANPKCTTDAIPGGRYTGSGHDISRNGLAQQFYGPPFFTDQGGGSMMFGNRSGTGGTVPHAQLRPTKGITLETWFMTFDPSAVEVYIGSQYGTSSDNSYALWSQSNDLRFGVKSGGSFDQRIISNVPYYKNTWYHFVGTFSTQEQKSRMYLNGRIIGEWDDTDGDITYDTSNTVVAIPGDFNGSGYNAGLLYPGDGLTSVFRIYERGLTTSEVLRNWFATKERFGY